MKVVGWNDDYLLILLRTYNAFSLLLHVNMLKGYYFRNLNN